jgi:hypothetical protein
MFASVFIAIRPRRRRTAIRKHMLNKHLYPQQYPHPARIFTVPSLRGIAPEPR